jgi:hypothetical protein
VRERKEQPAHPSVPVTYRFDGPVAEIYAACSSPASHAGIQEHGAVEFGHWFPHSDWPETGIHCFVKGWRAKAPGGSPCPTLISIGRLQLNRGRFSLMQGQFLAAFRGEGITVFSQA